MENTKKSILKEAIIEHEEIVNAAKANAQKKLAAEFPEKFNSLLKEELKKKDTNESVENKDGVEKVEKPLNEEVETKVDQETEKTKVSENETPVMKKKKLEEQDMGGAFTDQERVEEKVETPKVVSENEVDNDTNDEFLSIDDIEEEINRMEQLNAAAVSEETGEFGDQSTPKDEITDQDIEAALNEFEGLDDDGMDVDSLGGELDEFVDEKPAEDEVDETVNQDYANRRKMTGVHPRELPSNIKARNRYAMREGDEKFGKLLEENKKLTKRLNELKSKDKKAGELLESYKTAIQKYRDQLKEMAVFNTNLAHVNNLFVNESLSMTQEDKVKVINEFKTINDINESQEKYKSLLKEMSSSKKKSIDESIETKVNNSIQPSSKQKLDEVIEKNVYENNEHINKIKQTMNYVERRKK
jgi:hypothetical protein